MKVALFAPYFGPNPAQGFSNYYEYWLKSAAANHEIDFYIPTNLNISQYTQYDNIHYISMKVEEFWAKLQAILDFPISHSYYKTGEYRILFGIIFRDIIKDYDYWGYTEFDMIYGDIMKFVSPYLEKGAEVIGKTAPFRLMKNTEVLCNMPFAEVKGFEHPLTLEMALSMDHCWYFSEISGMNVRYHQAGIDVIPIDDFYGDISTKYKSLKCIGMKGAWGFNWENGHLVGYNDLHEEKEFLAIHLQKRSMKAQNGHPSDRFCIVPNVVLDDRKDCPNIRKGSFFYTVKRVSASYWKIYREHRELGTWAKDVLEELRVYCVKNGLFPPDRSGTVFKILYAIKRKILWV